MAYGCAEQPGTDWEAEACKNELRSRGVAWLPCEGDAMADLAQVFRNMPDMDELFEESADGSFMGCEVPGPRPARFILNKSAISENMRWFWAYDEETLALFDELAKKANLLPALEAVDGRAGNLMLYAASFIVVKGTKLGDSETLRHADMGHRRIPRGSSFTCLASLTDLPGSVGGLQFWPWESALYCNPFTTSALSAPALVHKYRPGKCVVFDGQLKHRTEPFLYERSLGGTPACCDDYEASGHIRVLVSLAFASSDAHLARYNHKMLRKQTCHEEALIRQSPKRDVDIDSELDTSDSDTECKKAPVCDGALRVANDLVTQSDQSLGGSGGGYSCVDASSTCDGKGPGGSNGCNGYQAGGSGVSAKSVKK
eukprot:TRINITY_DN103286_c0_g1_i1.p1 TRINITY_DN103286_c0_g1~~TRINITY_DN103286_c0_g1_i1.p1  ORF type:complete len:398 (-),score=58.04 TRINITY_DN103286_c0_g1_i1:232-1344(-)